MSGISIGESLTVFTQRFRLDIVHTVSFDNLGFYIVRAVTNQHSKFFGTYMPVTFMQPLISAVLRIVVDINRFLPVICLRHTDIDNILAIHFNQLDITIVQHATIDLLRIIQYIEQVGDKFIGILYTYHFESF